MITFKEKLRAIKESVDDLMGEVTTRWSFDKESKEWVCDGTMEERIEKLEKKINKITSFCTAASLISKTQQDKIEELEKESRSNRTYTLGRIVEFVKSINDFDVRIEELEKKVEANHNTFNCATNERYIIKQDIRKLSERLEDLDEKMLKNLEVEVRKMKIYSRK